LAYFCENRKNHGKITAVYIAANLLNSWFPTPEKNIYSRQNTYYDDVTVTWYSASK